VVRNSHGGGIGRGIGLRVGVAAACLLTALMTGCSTTTDGVAICPGCGTDAEPEFPTTRPSTTAPSTPPTSASSVPTTTQRPTGGKVLSPNANGYVYIETRSGLTRCQISADTVGCESEFTDSPTIDGESANGVEVYGQHKSARARRGSPVERVEAEFIRKPSVPSAVLQAIREADLIVYAPGSLYTSIIPLLQIPPLTAAVRSNRRAVKILAANFWIQET